MGDTSSGHSPGVKLSPDTCEEIEGHEGRTIIRVAHVHVRQTQRGCALPCSERAGLGDRRAGKLNTRRPSVSVRLYLQKLKSLVITLCLCLPLGHANPVGCMKRDRMSCSRQTALGTGTGFPAATFDQSVVS